MFDSNVRRALYNTTSARALAIALGLSFAAGSAVAGGALPASGQYVAGKGSIAKSGSSGLTIDQSSATGIIDWNSFSIGRRTASRSTMAAGRR